MTATEDAAARERHLAGRIAEGDLAARDELVERWIPYARQVARKYAGRGLDIDDLDQLGALGLMDAAAKFDPDKGRFSNYATLYIKMRVLQEIPRFASTIAITPDTYWGLLRHLAGKPVARSTPEDIERAVVASQARGGGDPFFLDTALTPEEQQGLATAGRPGPEELATLLSRLRPKQADAVRRRYGLGDYQPHTVAEIGQAWGVSKARAYQVASEAVRRLRQMASGADPGRDMLSPLEVRDVAAMRQQGAKYPAIADRFGISIAQARRAVVVGSRTKGARA